MPRALMGTYGHMAVSTEIRSEMILRLQSIARNDISKMLFMSDVKIR